MSPKQLYDVSFAVFLRPVLTREGKDILLGPDKEAIPFGGPPVFKTFALDATVPGSPWALVRVSLRLTRCVQVCVRVQLTLSLSRNGNIHYCLSHAGPKSLILSDTMTG
jgi:hypothetical protein